MDKREMLERVNKEYVRLGIKDGRFSESSLPYMAPEIFPKIRSNQIKAIINVFCEQLQIIEEFKQDK